MKLHLKLRLEFPSLPGGDTGASSHSLVLFLHELTEIQGGQTQLRRGKSPSIYFRPSSKLKKNSFFLNSVHVHVDVTTLPLDGLLELNDSLTQKSIHSQVLLIRYMNVSI